MNQIQNIIPIDEEARLAAIRRYDILDTPPDGAFDRITALAARRFDVPISIISVVDEDRIWFKSHHGLPQVSQIDREAGLCASAILSLEPHVLPDAKLDPRSLANPLVAGEFGLRFYAGIPLQTSDGFGLGTLCVIDKAPREVNAQEIDDLRDLASLVVDQLELRLAARQAISRAEILAREIDHRVMNSLQFVASMLKMQSRIPNLTDPASELKMAASRVSAVARVHRHFYTDEPGETASCTEFLERLCADLEDILGKQISVTGDSDKVPRSQIQSIGLIVNELVTNAAKHGQGKIEVSYRSSDCAHEISVCDEGSGRPVGHHYQEHEGLGSKLVRTLSLQLGGHVTAGNIPGRRGTCVVVKFPAHSVPNQ
ncbi:sensor histidine kinase [Mesorhizobium sp. 10J20-29]